MGEGSNLLTVYILPDSCGGLPDPLASCYVCVCGIVREQAHPTALTAVDLVPLANPVASYCVWGIKFKNSLFLGLVILFDKVLCKWKHLFLGPRVTVETLGTMLLRPHV